MTRPVGRCKACDVPMMSEYAWKMGMRPEGHAYHAAHGLCGKHYNRWKRFGTTELVGRRAAIKPRGPAQRRLDEVLEEYAMVRDDVGHLRQAAERMGMSYSALDKALYRARKKGLPGAQLPMQQLDRIAA